MAQEDPIKPVTAEQLAAAVGEVPVAHRGPDVFSLIERLRAIEMHLQTACNIFREGGIGIADGEAVERSIKDALAIVEQLLRECRT